VRVNLIIVLQGEKLIILINILSMFHFIDRLVFIVSLSVLTFKLNEKN